MRRGRAMPSSVDTAVAAVQDIPQTRSGKETEMPETPSFGRYAEIPYDEMTPEQQEGYRFLVETRGAAGGPSKIWVHNPKLVKASAPLGCLFPPRRLLALRA